MDTAQLPKCAAGAASDQLVLAGSFTIEPVEAPLQWAASILGIGDVNLRFAGFGQVMQSLLDPTEAFARNVSGVNVLLVRPKDADAAELTDALGQYDACAAAPLCVLVCPQREPAPTGWELDVTACSKVIVVRISDVWDCGPADFDSRSEEVSSGPPKEVGKKFQVRTSATVRGSRTPYYGIALLNDQSTVHRVECCLVLSFRPPRRECASRRRGRPCRTAPAARPSRRPVGRK